MYISNYIKVEIEVNNVDVESCADTCPFLNKYGYECNLFKEDLNSSEELLYGFKRCTKCLNEFDAK